MRLDTARMKCLRVQEMEIKRYKSLNWIGLDWMTVMSYITQFQLKPKVLLLLLIDIISVSQGIQKPDAYCKVVQFPIWIQFGDIKNLHLESQKKSYLSPHRAKLIAENYSLQYCH